MNNPALPLIWAFTGQYFKIPLRFCDCGAARPFDAQRTLWHFGCARTLPALAVSEAAAAS
jgi:hypothetical protein